ncbi:MAG: tryptophan synthase subunit alpha [Gemmataceae bacterium]
MNPIDNTFQALRDKKRKAFIPFITAGDPDVDTTVALARELAARGASLIEIGIPYSDPIADGSVIQASYTRALDKGVKIDAILAALRTLTVSPDWKESGVPLVAMVSFSLVHHRGPERFIAQAREAGLSGAIVPDLPVDEAEPLAREAAKQDFKLIQLVTPTTPRERALRIARTSTGFLYCVSVVGITGERSEIPPSLLEQLAWLRGQTPLPLCVGFGISKAEHVRLLREAADGVIVGSAIVRRLEEMGRRPGAEVIAEIGAQVEKLVAALHGK